MAKDVNWGMVFGGVSVAVAIVTLYKMNGSGSSNAAPTQNIFPALNEQAMAGPSVPGYNIPTLALSNGQQPTNSQTPPNYMSNNQLTSRKKKLHHKWTQWRKQNQAACDPCNCSSTTSQGCQPTGVIQNAGIIDLFGSLFNTNNVTPTTHKNVGGQSGGPGTPWGPDVQNLGNSFTDYGY